ncbi:ankyrin repeat and sterile alpha motif domain-containing protein 1B-like [Ruditapes philippinarum]|uniref:ankyrin repeat and sterile alpha motif domain-containing protein 1B-like n=1 Tax=Ruditapes philippinarum TaxID=129788 RepID=UPI00295C2F55|nr:ankyrin repeat and sterile alpha motif domain-containing protein 1B-like [Ruditapes philippinarum]XP_060568286.1 ankyrin repeat and sterile alpha motif domain-containing protein 1B-like [Ruditapes philippinarum]
MGLAASRQEAFWESCGFGHVERARHFLEQGDIDVNWVSYTNDCCPIHVASQGKPDIVKLLLEHKCNVNVRDNRDNLPLHHAAMKGHADIVQTLLDAGSEINAQEKNGWTALHNAAYWCHPEVVRVLLKNGCDVHIQNKDERTALHECARSQQKNDQKLGEIAQILIDAGCDINSKSSDWGEADLTGLMYASFHNHPDVASALIEAGCELNSVGTTFWSALHWAADRGNDELVYILLDAGIDPTIRDMRGETAAERAQTDDIKEFIKTAIVIQKDLTKVKQPVIRPARQLCKPEEPFKPKCDANFKSQSFLPKDWKPSNPVNVKNLINEKKSRLAAMTSQKYRNDLARRTGTGVIKDEDIKTSDDDIKTSSDDIKMPSDDKKKSNEEIKNSDEDIKKSSEDIKKSVEDVETCNEDIKKSDEDLKNTDDNTKIPEEDIKDSNSNKDILESENDLKFEEQPRGNPDADKVAEDYIERTNIDASQDTDANEYNVNTNVEELPIFECSENMNSVNDRTDSLQSDKSDNMNETVSDNKEISKDSENENMQKEDDH